jgi:hypothetical protein
MSSHRSHGSGAIAALLVVAGAGVAAATTLACGGATRDASKSPVTAASVPSPPRAAAPGATAASPPPVAGPEEKRELTDNQADEDAELVVSRNIVAACPTLRLVRTHMEELDPDMVWLAVLEAIGDCMGEGGPMEQKNIGVSGDEEHRHIVREVLSTHGIAPTRVVARPHSSAGAAECQGDTSCGRRVEITIIEP